MNHGAYGATPARVVRAQQEYVLEEEGNIQVNTNFTCVNMHPSSFHNLGRSLSPSPHSHKHAQNWVSGATGYRGKEIVVRQMIAAYVNAPVDDVVLIEVLRTEREREREREIEREREREREREIERERDETNEQTILKYLQTNLFDL